MIDGIIWLSLKNRMIVILASALLLCWGVYEAARMPIDVFPDLNAPTITVVTEAHGMAPEEVETLITFPIETALNGASGVRRVRSATGVGISIVWVEFDWGAETYRARQIVSEKLILVQGTLPPEIDPPVMAPASSIMGEIMFLALSSDSHSPLELKTYADTLMRRRLLSVPGVSQIMPIGGETKQYQIVVQPERLISHGVTLEEVVEAVAASNHNSSAGFYQEGGREYLIQGMGRARDVQDLAKTVIKVVDSQPILVSQVADVKIGAAFKRGEGSHNGKDAIVIGVHKQPGANTVALSATLDAAMAEIQAALPKGMVLENNIFRQADFIELAIANVLAALRDGAILVVLIVLLFLASTRATIITTLAIPISLVVAVLVMKLMGATINTMTLGGMAIAIGALVDDAIIDVENVTRRLRENLASGKNLPVLEVVFNASKEIRVSIVFATLIIILVFLPLFFLTGVEGRLLRPLGLAYITALSASLVTALTLTPVLCSLFLPSSKGLQHIREAAFVRWLKRIYLPALKATAPRWKTVTGASTLLLIGALVLMLQFGKSFLPDFNEGTLTINATTQPGTSLQVSHQMGRLVETILLRQPEVVNTARRTGRGELDDHAQGVHASEVDVTLDLKGHDKAEFLERLRRELAIIPGMNIVIGQPISHRIDHMLSGTRASVAIKVFGSDLLRLRRLAEQVRETAATVPGVVDLSVEQQADIPYLNLKIDRTAIAKYGLSVEQVAEFVETAFAGRKVSEILEGSTVFDLVVRMDDQVMAQFETLSALPVTTASGAQVPLDALVQVVKDQGPNMIIRENAQRDIVVSCNVAGRDIGSVVDEIRNKVNERVELPPGYHVRYGGQFESAQAAAKTLFLVGGIVVVGVFMLLLMSLGSGRDAALVMVNLPLALVGGVVGVYMSGSVMSVASIIGFITLFGIATRNGILLVSHIHHLIREEGVSDRLQAIEQASLERLSPILMTAASAALALIPLALNADKPGGEIEAPMAIVILCGLISSTILNLLVVPALYRRFGSLRPV